MKFLVVLSVALACVLADVPHIVSKDDYEAPILKSSFESSPEGNFQYGYETGNGIYAQAVGTIKDTNSEYPAVEIQGSYKYTAPDGTDVETSYVADKDGFKAVGSHIPVPPEVPEAILRSLAYNAAHPAPAEPLKPPTFQGKAII